MHPQLDQCLNFILRTEFLATLARIKPLSIIRAFEQSTFEKAWKDSWSQGVIQNSDLVWKLKDHISGPILWVGSKTELQKYFLNCDGDALFEFVEKKAASLGSEAERHTFWGTLLGYPKSAVLEYRGRSAESGNSAIFVPLFPLDFKPSIPAGFLTKNFNNEDVVIFLKRTYLAAESLEMQMTNGVHPASIINGWNFFP